MQQTPWFHRPAVVLALLVVFPPAGIFLMWKGLPWARNTKLGVGVLSGAWFVVMIVLSNADKTNQARPAPATSMPTKPAPKPATPITPVKAVSTAPSNPRSALIDKEPLLLVPAKLNGFVLASADPLPKNVPVGVAAHYTSSSASTKRLIARLLVSKSDVKLQPADSVLKPIKIGEHDGRITDDADEKTIIVEWVSGGWDAVASVDYERPADIAAAKSAAQKIAPEVSADLDRYLTGTPPSETERQQQLAAIAEATSTTNVHTFAAKMNTAGITNDLVTSVKVDGNPDELVITVGSTWHQTIKHERLMAAQNLWSLWSGINSPTNPDKSRIKIVDVNGNEVGGSGVIAGSSISVIE